MLKINFDSLSLFMVWLMAHSKKDYDYVKPLYDAFDDFVLKGGKKNG